MSENQQITATNAVESDKKLNYVVNGEQVTLSRQIVRKYLVRGNAEVTDAEIVQFISMCSFNKYNPFLNEAYLVKYQGKNPTAQMIVSKEALFKRADNCEAYDGFQAGIIVQRGKDILELEGTFTLEGDKLLGGWAKVYRSDRKYPVVAKVNFSEYDKKQSIWVDKPGTMISKVAKVQAMREAFPRQFGAMYIAEEQIQDVGYEDVSTQIKGEIAAKANKLELGMAEQEDGQQQAEEARPVVVKPTSQPQPQQSTLEF